MGRRILAAASLIALACVLTAAVPHVRGLWQTAVALAGLILPVSWAASCAVIIPIMQTVLFGAPYLTTDLPLFVCQMIALAVCANFFCDMQGWNRFGSIAAALGVSLVVLFCAASIFGAVSGGLSAGRYVLSALTAGWPGMLLMLILVPPAADCVRSIQERWR